MIANVLPQHLVDYFSLMKDLYIQAYLPLFIMSIIRVHYSSINSVLKGLPVPMAIFVTAAKSGGGVLFSSWFTFSTHPKYQMLHCI